MFVLVPAIPAFAHGTQVEVGNAGRDDITVGPGHRQTVQLWNRLERPGCMSLHLSHRSYRWALPLGAVAALVVSAAAPAAAFVPGPTPIGPGQAFVPLVNGQSTTATVLVDCPTGRLGHPAPGQTVAVTQASAAGTHATGFTGSAADSIVLGTADAANSPLQLRTYDQPVALPTTLVVPCAGSGLFTFVPAPDSPTASAASVKVTFSRAA